MGKEIDFTGLTDSQVLIEYVFLLDKMILFSDKRNFEIEEENKRIRNLLSEISKEAERIKKMGLKRLW